MLRLTVLFFLLALAGAADAQPLVLHAHDDGAVCTLYDVDGVARPGPAISPASTARRSGASHTVVTQGRSATFSVTYAGFTTQAEAAFQRAVDVWADHLTSPVPIRVEASFEDLGSCQPGQSCVLGSAGPRLTRFNPPAPPGARASTWYPFALADALAGQDIFPPEGGDANADIQARFNSEANRFHFGTGDPPQTQIDFTTVVLHELGHGLGFIGSGDVDNGSTADGAECTGIAGRGCWGYFNGQNTGFPLIFDRFIQDGAGTAFLNQTAYPNNSAPLGGLLQSEDLFVNATTAVSLNGGTPPPIWAPAAFEGGSSFSHWDEILFTRGTSAALMTPQISNGEKYTDPGTLTCAFFQDMGWDLGDGCTFLVTDAEDVPGDAFDLVVSGTDYGAVGPNPFARQSVARLALGVPQWVEVDLVDVLGRQVQSLYSGEAAAGALRLVVDGSRLAPGVYVLRARGASASASVSLTHVE